MPQHRLIARFATGIALLSLPCVAIGAATGNYATSKFFLLLDGSPALSVKSVDGGNATCTPIVRGQRTDKYPDKVPGSVRYEEAVITLPVSTMSIPLWDWVNAFSSPAPNAAKRVTVLTADYSYKEQTRRVFDDAVVVGVEFPALDATLSKDVLNLKLLLAPTRTKTEPPVTGGKIAIDAIGNNKPLMAGNFRMTVDGLPASHVTRVEPIVIKRTSKNLPDYSTLALTITGSDADAWIQWEKQAVEGQGTERNGKLELLSANLSDVQVTVRLEGLGFIRLFQEKVDPSGGGLPQTRVDLYVEKVTFEAAKSK